MTVLSFSMQRLPRVSRSAATWGRALERALFEVTEPFTLELGGVGPVRITVEGVAATAGVPAACEELSLVGGDGRRARLSVELRLALALVSGALGLPSPVALRGLGVGERGILAGQIAAVLARLGSRVAVDVGRGPRASDEPRPAVALAVETRGCAGRACLALPRAWLAAPPVSGTRLRARLRDEAWRLRIDARVELAATHVAAAAWASARPGDAVVFDGVAWGGTTAGWPVDLRVGEHAARARLDAAGALAIIEQFRAAAPRATGPAARSAVLSTEEPATMSAPPDADRDPDDTNHAVLAAAPIEIVAEVGRFSLRGDELLRLRPGSVLPLGARGPDVLLTAGGEPWARGELVDVDGELGVRIVALTKTPSGGEV